MREAAAERLLERVARDPVVPQRLDEALAGLDLTLLRGEELEDAYLHGVVVELHLVDDPPGERQHLVAVEEGAGAGREKPLRGRPDAGSYRHGELVIDIQAPPELGVRRSLACLAHVEEGNGQREARAHAPGAPFALGGDARLEAGQPPPHLPGP